MAHTRTWDETAPPNTQAVAQGAQRIREFKVDVRERMAIDHIWSVDVNTDGRHNKVTMPVQGGDPTNIASTGILYTKDVSAKAELFFIDEDGNVIQLTTAGEINFPSVAFSDLTGSIANGQVPASAVTQHIANILASLLGVDGSGSGLDADLLDGSHASAFAAVSHNHAASEVTSGTFANARIAASNVTQHQGSINHDSLSGFVANEHRLISAQSGGSPSGGSDGDVILIY